MSSCTLLYSKLDLTHLLPFLYLPLSRWIYHWTCIWLTSHKVLHNHHHLTHLHQDSYTIQAIALWCNWPVGNVHPLVGNFEILSPLCDLYLIRIFCCWWRSYVFRSICKHLPSRSWVQSPVNTSLHSLHHISVWSPDATHLRISSSSRISRRRRVASPSKWGTAQIQRTDWCLRFSSSSHSSISVCI